MPQPPPPSAVGVGKRCRPTPLATHLLQLHHDVEKGGLVAVGPLVELGEIAGDDPPAVPPLQGAELHPQDALDLCGNGGRDGAPEHPPAMGDEHMYACTQHCSKQFTSQNRLPPWGLIIFFIQDVFHKETFQC